MNPRAGGEGQGRPSPYFLFTLALFLALAGQVFAQGLQPVLPAKNAGLQGRPVQAYRQPTADELAAARGLEQMLVDQMIQEMRKTVPENEFVPVTQGERIFRQMLDQEYSRAITESGTLGIAEQVLAEIQGRR